MPIIEPVIRPPSEADSFLLQVTTGCSVNTCSFCGAYKGKRFTKKSFAEIANDIEEHASRDPGTRRVFLMDGDALALTNAELVPILDRIRGAFPLLSRIASYANGTNIVTRSDDDLTLLYTAGLRLVYIGLESGSQQILDQCRKRSTVHDMGTAVARCQRYGIKASVIVLLGLGGRAFSEAHVQGTIEALNRMQPRYLSFLSVMVIPGTGLSEMEKKKLFEPLGRDELLREARAIIAGLELEGTIFRSDHASNYLPLEGRFPKDKERLVSMLDAGLQRKVPLRFEWMRGL